MQVSNWIIIGAAEVFTLLMLICIFLILHTSKLKNLIKGLQQKVQDLLTDLQQTKRAYAEMQDLLEDNEPEYAALLDEQIEHTKEYHKSLDPDQDISLDLDDNASMPRQIASLRHAFLITEKEANLSGENNQPNWLVIQSKLATIMAFFKGSNSQSQLQTFEEDADPVTELQTALSEKQQEVANLEGSLTQAQREAQEVHKGLAEIEVAAADQAAFNELLNRYQNAMKHMGGSDTTEKESHTEEITTTVEVVRDASHSNEELHQLRSLTADQHAMINKLQQRLKAAQTQEEKVLLINDLSEQLERQKRFVQESETCIELMDNELNEANSTIADLQQQLTKYKSQQGSGRQNDMADQIKALQANIQRLEQENEQLVMQLGMGE